MSPITPLFLLSTKQALGYCRLTEVTGLRPIWRFPLRPPSIRSPQYPPRYFSSLKIPSHHQALPRLKVLANPQVNPPTYPTPNSTSPAPSPASPTPTSPVPSNMSVSDSRRNPTAQADCTTVRSIACGSSSGKAAGSEGCIEVKL